MSSVSEAPRYESVVRRYQIRITLVVALLTGAYLLYLNRNLWFYGDDFSFIFDRYFEAKSGDLSSAILQPHNEHPAILPSATYLLIESVFGLNHHWIFMIPVLAMHTVIVICVGFLLSKVITSPVLVVAGTCVVAFLSAGVENLFWAFQFGFIGAIAFGFLHLVLVYGQTVISWRDYVGALCAIAAVTTQGTGLTSLFVVAIYLILSRRWKALVIAITPAAFVFLLWRVSYGSNENHSKPTQYQLLELHKYVWKGLTTAADGIFHLTGIAAVLLLSLLVFFSLRYARSPRYYLGISLLTGAIFFYTVNGLGRIHLGIDQAGVSRYAYVGVALLVIPLFFSIDTVLTKVSTKNVIALAIATWAVVVGSMELTQHSRFRVNADSDRFGNMSAAIELSYSQVVRLDALPSPTLDPNVSVGDLLQADEAGLWPERKFRGKNVLDTANRVSILLTPTADNDLFNPHKLSGYINANVTLKNDNCVRIEPLSSPQIVVTPLSDEPLFLTSDYGAQLNVILQTDKQLRSVEVGHELLAGQTYALTGWLTDTDVVLNLPSNSSVDLCNVQLP